ncbi:aspartyl protease family protein [Pontibacter sp. G13]|uniref:aspartyl protease family protein n=1 Tax=Pontibacter sp. G13 TaxID=3074898 RepID=UPI00288BF954|nr:aspartyl protease family protein [Pontibacter sp. G13]WNJ20968.1 aspartyl protease family protein [Pontibacter sp. G13]
MRYTLLLILCLLGVSSAAWSKTAGFRIKGNASSVKIPVEIQNNIILVPLKINDSFEMTFILDTGVKSTILTEPLVAKILGLELEHTVSIRGLGEGGSIPASYAKDVEMSLPGIEGKGVNLLVLPEGVISYSEMFGRPVYGIIGFDIFGQFTVEINYHQEYIRLSYPFNVKPKTGKKWQSFPIELRKHKPYIEATLVDHLGVPRTSKWLLDTGASMAVSMFDDEFPVPQNTIDSFLGMGLSGNVYGKLGRSPRLIIGDYELEGVITGYPDPTALNMVPTDTTWYGNMGAEILSRFRVIFDYHQGKIYLRKNPSFGEDFEYNLSGLEVMAAGNEFERFVIAYVRPESPAHEAGLQQDDEIISVNGQSTNGKTIEDLYGDLTKRPGKTLNLKVLRSGKMIRKKFRLIAEI